MKKRFIEWDLPLAEISEQSAKEKNIRHGHPSTLHIWWARRPLASSRVTNFTSLIKSPVDEKEAKEITELIKKIVTWKSVNKGNSTDIIRAQNIIKEQWDNPPKVLDPFSGGGSIPFEALRLGCETYASDYNPVAVFIEKSMMEWPQKYGIMFPNPDGNKGIDGSIEKINFLLFMVKKWSNYVFEKIEEELGIYYPKETDGSIPIGYIWARTIKCSNPNCNAEIPLMRQYWLVKKTKKKIYLKPKKDIKNKKINFDIINGEPSDFDPKNGTISRANAICPFCNQVTKSNQIRKKGCNGEIGQKLIAIIYFNPRKKGKFYRLATKKDKDVYKKAEKYLKEKLEKWKWIDNPIPDEEMPRNMTGCIAPPNYGIYNYGDLFNTRQKLILITIIDQIKLSYDRIKKDCDDLGIEKYNIENNEVTKIIIYYLGIIFDSILVRNTSLNVWDAGYEKISNLFGRQALSMVWDYIECNPLSGSTGSWKGTDQWIVKVIKHASNFPKPAEIKCSSATSLSYPNDFFDAVFTDPPYYNNVPYADLSDFFYVWLKRIVGNISDLFSTPLSPKSLEICEMNGWDNKRYAEKDKEFFERELSKSISEIYRVLKPFGILTLVYAHKTTAGWETMLNSLIKSGFVVTASWPIHTEMKNRLRAASSAALASSIYIVCRKIDRKKVGFYSEIKPKIRTRIEEKLNQFWEEGIAGGDFFISAIGPGMEIFSQYGRIEKVSGEVVNTKDLLTYIRTVSTDFIVNKLLENTSTAKIDNESEFYLAFRWTYLDNTVIYDDARKLASASGVNLEKLWDSKGFVKKSGSKISVLGPKDRDKIEKPKSMVDVMHKVVLLWEKGEKEQLTQLLADTGYGKDPAFKQFCQAVAESLLNGNKEKQLLEGFLIGIDVYSKGKSKVGRDQTDLKQFGGS